MPNHVINEVTLHDVNIEEVRKTISSKKSPIDFRVLLPIPINYWQGSEGLEHEKNMAGCAMPWCRKNWGTKWTAYDLNEDSVRQIGHDVVLTFQTAWNHPRPWVTALFNTLECPIKAIWLSEGSCHAWREDWRINAERLHTLSPDWTITEIEEDTGDYKRLDKLLWGK